MARRRRTKGIISMFKNFRRRQRRLALAQKRQHTARTRQNNRAQALLIKEYKQEQKLFQQTRDLYEDEESPVQLPVSGRRSNTDYQPVYWEPPSHFTDTQKEEWRRDHGNGKRSASKPKTIPSTATRADEFYGWSGFAEDGLLPMISQEEYNRLPVEEREERLRATGHCGAPTKDGSSCLNGKGCSIPSHKRARK